MTRPTNIDLSPKTRGLTAIAGAVSLIAVLLIVQIWLLIAALESFLAGKHHTALPAATFSGSMFLICLGFICSSIGLTLMFGTVTKTLSQTADRPATLQSGPSFVTIL